ncbi:chromate transporter [Robbsia andropogonis]|uniref:Chromate transporter n=1 Tax=Robbsia andropogonis TaxID=28092 RepID=A0A0F5K4K4_9BURK|nr:chromate transporter [Robbsia andropogonis]KKB65036.1 chromate transporter [Robbsia andropogonis]
MSLSSKTLWQLAAVFAPLSLATIGGGQAIIADIQRQVVDVHGWLTHAQFAVDFAISRMAPGPGSLLATLIGWQIAGFWGAVVATMALLAPTGLLVYGLTHVWARYRGALFLSALERGLRPVAAGMILAAGWVLLTTLDGGAAAKVIALCATVMLLLSRINPLLLLLMGAVLLLGVHTLGGVVSLPALWQVRLS